MTRKLKAFVNLAFAALVGGTTMAWNGDLPSTARASFASSAEARIGRPLTPMSYAGVARRTTRRAVAVGTAAGTAVYVAPAYTTTCRQVVDVYGRIAIVCR